MTLTKLGFTDKTRERLNDLAAGGIAGGIANYVVKPIDQVADAQARWATSAVKEEAEASKSILATTKKLYRDGGVKGFYAGSKAKLLKIVPATALSYMLYEFAKDRLSNK